MPDRFSGSSRRLIPRLGVGLVAGLLMGSAFSGPVWSVMAPVGLAALISCLPGVGVQGAAATGASFGVGFLGLTLGWLWSAIGPGAWAALTLVETVFVVVAVVGMRAVTSLRIAPLWCGAVWMTVEVLRSSWPLGGLPWGRLAYSAPDAPWAFLLPLFGVSGTGLVLATVAAWAGLTAARAVRSAGGRASVTVGGALVGLAAIAGLAGLVGLVGWAASVSAGSPPEGSGSVRVAVVQGGVPGGGTDLLARHGEVTRRHGAETARLMSSAGSAAGEVDFVLWPENSLAVDPARDSSGRQVLDLAVRRAGVPLFAGMVTTSAEGAVRNQGVVWTPSGAADRYTKQHLVPFGEYVPWRPLAERISDRVAAIERDMTPGDTATEPVRVGGVLVADALCFDVAYDDVIAAQVRGGAELVTVQTSNAMFLGTDQPEQQWAISRTRALESGRSVVVASINGVSGAIAPDGTVIERLQGTGTASVVVEVPLRTDLTLATRLAAIPTVTICVLGVMGAVLGAFVTARRSRTGTD